MSQKVPIHQLPLPSTTLQSTLPRLPLAPQPSAQRRSTTFKSDTPGIWARVYPLWASWPLRITKEEVQAMGVDVDNGGQVSVEDVLQRWDPVDILEEAEEGGRRVMSSEHRLKVEPYLLGVAEKTLQDSLPGLEVGDAVEVCNVGGEAAGEETDIAKARQMLVDVLSGRKVVTCTSGGEGRGEDYGPWSTRYVGHQFGSYAGQLGDGRAISLLETESPGGGRQEIQLKGAGRTPFSRSADGLAVLRSGVREFLGCEAVAALGIPTTRSLALLTADIQSIPVFRETGAEPPSLLARIAPSFIRIGHFEALNPGRAARNMRQIFFGGNWAEDESSDADEKGALGGQGNLEGLERLVRWCKDEVMGMREASVQDWVREVVKRNAEMVAGWQVYGWMHGVLNSDNISVLGLTIDYGPYAFMDVWDEGHICNHSDYTGLYSYRAQPSRVLWALDKFVSAVCPLIGYEALNGSIKSTYHEGATKDDVEEWDEKGLEVMKGWEEGFWEVERSGERDGWLKRFGLNTYKSSDDREVIFDYLTLLRTHSLDFHASFRHLCSFQPTKADSTEYLEDSATALIEGCTTQIKEDDKVQAVKGLVAWLASYAERIKAEQQSWEGVKVGWSDAEVKLFGERGQADRASKGEMSGWEEVRGETMRRVNPRFVLRQWVLEDTISKLEDSGVGNIQEGRKVLAKILDMSTRPFYPWGEQGSGDDEDAKLCGLGKKEMLGFQCSCSS